MIEVARSRIADTDPAMDDAVRKWEQRQPVQQGTGGRRSLAPAVTRADGARGSR
jgi:hypothetical protein